jgi:hypothetical protein
VVRKAGDASRWLGATGAAVATRFLVLFAEA